MSKTLRNIIIVCIAAAAIVLTSLVALTSCTDPAAKKMVSTEKQREIYAFTAVSGAALLADSFADKPAGIAAADSENTEPLTRPDGITDEDTARIKEYLGMFEGYILNNGITPETTVPTEDDGEYAAYQVKLVINLPNVSGGTDEYVMYYNEIDNGGAKDGDKKAAEAGEEDTDNEDNEVEIESGIEGYMIYADHAFPLIGEKEIETEEGETESELSIKVFLSDTERNTYIGIKQEIENDEIEYVYSVHENGKLVSKTSVEFENDAEENEQEIKLSFRDTASGAPSNTWFKIEKDNEGDSTFNVKYNVNDGRTQKFDISVNEGIYTFTYRNGFSEII